MSDNIVLDMLRAIRSDIVDMNFDLSDIKQPIGLLEMGYSSLSRRVDRMGGDVERIKRRLDIADAPAG